MKTQTSTTDGHHLMWLETEHFSEFGGWVNDAQFLDLMGSPYLLATGMGIPVADAVSAVPVPEAATYRLWARSKDWYPQHHPGQFRILLDGDPGQHVFGCSGRSGWQWEDGGTHELAGTVDVALHDLTGYYSRCDVVVLTSDLEWQPPDAVEDIARLRELHGGISAEIADAGHYDVVVLGGGLAGCTAAVAAARNGACVALIQNRPVLGGNASTEILVPPVGLWPRTDCSPLNPRETGFLEEYRTRGDQRVSEGKLYSERLLRSVDQEEGIDLYLNRHAIDADLDSSPEKRIAAVIALDVNTGHRVRIAGTMFVDCTGDSAISVAAGAEYRHGKETRAMHNEPWAGEEPSSNTMGNGLKYHCRDTGAPQPFKAPPWIYRFDQCADFTPGRHPHLPTSVAIGYQWQTELGGLRDTYADAEEIRDDLFRLIFGLWDHSKNSCPRHRNGAENLALEWVGHITAKRENRRLIGDHILTQNDIGDRTLFPDRVAYGAWIVDDHYSAGFFHDGQFGWHMDDPENAHAGVEFSIPFRSLYSRNVTNLLMAGRNISATHLGMSNTRVMMTCAIMGHAVGTGAALCVQSGVSPRTLARDRISQLQQQLLKEGAYIIDLQAADPADLARNASIGASSEATPAIAVTNGFSRATPDSPNAWTPDPDSEGPHWLCLTWDEPETLNTIHVTFQTTPLAPTQFSVEIWREDCWERVAEIADNRHRRHVLGLDELTTDRLRVVLPHASGICEVRVYRESPEAVATVRRAHDTMCLPDHGPWLPWPEAERVGRLPGIVVESEETHRVGHWVCSTWSGQFLGQDGYLHDGNSGKGHKSLRFDLPVAGTGQYELRLAYAACDNRATNTPVHIRTVDGLETVRVNQQAEPPIDGLFVSLGVYELSSDAAVTVANEGTDGYVAADVVQALPIEAECGSDPRSSCQSPPV
ncbi:MAG: FAD-dependent oxidoreductase [Lentisphaerae bacterium]|nr:FAD-dependent oxidoreductase [Lentisphaerota bacterium]MBT4814619.1 FAD-dependent oxidoreductase [Lentisphaerota bacterium]MBT5605450.1 FAD-dependent oxidoreductase [Lentisphaerota bacterium]MBT7060119.1 FAD-dependent oxidoreductase [Lentisphaerota bacterium]MBT7840821.1 FAD-dependent oxidoreductase [Lentisphaerota bacterium]